MNRTLVLVLAVYLMLYHVTLCVTMLEFFFLFIYVLSFYRCPPKVWTELNLEVNTCVLQFFYLFFLLCEIFSATGSQDPL